MSAEVSDAVVISWRDCNCGWGTKYCDEEHTRYASVSRETLEHLVFGSPDSHQTIATEGES